jgi:hypothetical protein
MGEIVPRTLGERGAEVLRVGNVSTHVAVEESRWR